MAAVMCGLMLATAMGLLRSRRVRATGVAAPGEAAFRRITTIVLLVAEGRKHGLAVFSAPRVNLDGEPISSTRIRALLEAGDVVAANALLARFVFKTPFVLSPLVLLISVAAAVAVTLVTGLITNRGVVDHPPLEVLRQET